MLTVAKLFGRKGLDVLLMAVETLASESHGYKFVIVGDGPEERGLRELTAHLKIEKHVNFYGEALVEDIPVLIQNCAFVVLPSRSEPFGIVLLEAMTFGKAIVATSVGGIPEIVTDGYNGLLVPSENVQLLAEKIRLLLRDLDLRARIGKNGLSYVERHGDYGSLVRRYENQFARVLGQEEAR